jgi:hypothetical protein
MLTLLPPRMSATFACRGSWILSAFCPPLPALFLFLCARFLPAISFWLERLLLMRQCLLVAVCLLLARCTVACDLSRCRPLPVLPGVANPPSAPSEVPRPKPLWGKAWFPICFFFQGAMSGFQPLGRFFAGEPRRIKPFLVGYPARKKSNCRSLVANEGHTTPVTAGHTDSHIDKSSASSSESICSCTTAT